MNDSNNQPRCPFCHPREGEVFYTSELVKGVWDTYPANPGHALIVPHRHVARWFDATPEEQAALAAAIEHARSAIEENYSPQGFNIGFNDRKAAGQSVPHLHIHIIPRYDGDTPDWRGGIRKVLPTRAKYPKT
ncbi:MAG: HIT domain-containing protein [Xanthomonadales bacterium]|nr:HIT domain-containing protein [Xanthomonadales bacterium]